MITSLAAPAPDARSLTATEREPPDDPPPTVASGLAEARALAMNLARCVVEILAGTREIDQIARWLSSDVYTHLLKRVVISARARTARGESPGRLTFTMGSTVVCEPTPGVVEAVVIVHGRARSRAVAIRLEILGTRWRASAIHVL